MPIICHRVNTRAALNALPTKYGVEIDIRHDNRSGRLYLHHDPGDGEDLEAYLEAYRHRFIIFNIKESGIEEECRRLAKQQGIETSSYFLLDVEFPYLYQASRRGVREIAVRYSEDEPLAQVSLYKQRVDWVWIDTMTRLPLDHNVITELAPLKPCLVCPERWGRPEDIPRYVSKLQQLGVTLDAVMTGKSYLETWESSGVIRP